jgi:hypothetical protein
VCGTYNVNSWAGTIDELPGPDSDTTCQGEDNYDLDPSQTNQLSLTPDGSGGCNVNGSFSMIQSAVSAGTSSTVFGDFCGQWSGMWNCIGHVDVKGDLTLLCNCKTVMTGTGFRNGTSNYIGNWVFSLKQVDNAGGVFEDDGLGSFILTPVSAAP